MKSQASGHLPCGRSLVCHELAIVFICQHTTLADAEQLPAAPTAGKKVPFW